MVLFEGSESEASSSENEHIDEDDDDDNQVDVSDEEGEQSASYIARNWAAQILIMLSCLQCMKGCCNVFL